MIKGVRNNWCPYKSQSKHSNIFSGVVLAILCIIGLLSTANSNASDCLCDKTNDFYETCYLEDTKKPCVPEGY